MVKIYPLISEIKSMNISNGLSVINIPSAGETSGVKKVYLWPDYGAGAVNKIKPVARETDGGIYYTSSTDEERERIISAVKQQKEMSYSSGGSILHKNSLVSPGILFDARV